MIAVQDILWWMVIGLFVCSLVLWSWRAEIFDGSEHWAVFPLVALIVAPFWPLLAFAWCASQFTD